MIAAIDVYYTPAITKSVAVLFEWEEDKAHIIYSTQITDVTDYVPGKFYLTELPCLLKVIEQIDLSKIEAIIIDGYVFIDDNDAYGLGAYLWEALERKIPVIGVAKRKFHPVQASAREIYRGESDNLLYVSAVGYNLENAARHIKSMKGKYRIPTILKELDSLTKS